MAEESMRILFWSETFWPRVGGVENLAATLLPALQARRHEFVVVTWENMEIPDVIHYQGIPVYRFPFFSGPRDRLDPLIENRRLLAVLEKEPEKRARGRDRRSGRLCQRERKARPQTE